MIFKISASSPKNQFIAYPIINIDKNSKNLPVYENFTRAKYRSFRSLWDAIRAICVYSPGQTGTGSNRRQWQLGPVTNGYNKKHANFRLLLWSRSADSYMVRNMRIMIKFDLGLGTMLRNFRCTHLSLFPTVVVPVRPCTHLTWTPIVSFYFLRQVWGGKGGGFLNVRPNQI